MHWWSQGKSEIIRSREGAYNKVIVPTPVKHVKTQTATQDGRFYVFCLWSAEFLDQLLKQLAKFMHILRFREIWIRHCVMK